MKWFIVPARVNDTKYRSTAKGGVTDQIASHSSYFMNGAFNATNGNELHAGAAVTKPFEIQGNYSNSSLPLNAIASYIVVWILRTICVSKQGM